MIFARREAVHRAQPEHDRLELGVLHADLLAVDDGKEAGQDALHVLVQVCGIEQPPPAHKRTCAHPDADILSAPPVVEVVPALEPLFAEVAHFIAVISLLFEQITAEVIERGDLVPVGQLAVEIIGVDGRAVLGRQGIHGDVLCPAARGDLDGLSDVLLRLVLDAQHDIGGEVLPFDQGGAIEIVAHGVDSAQIRKLLVDRRLQADGEAIDARALVHGDLLFAHRSGVHFDRDLRAGGKRKALFDLPHDGIDILGVDDAGRAAAEIDGVKRSALQLLAAHLQFFEDARHVRLGDVHAVGKGDKVAVRALVFAEGNVNIDACHITPPSGICSDRRNRLRPARPPPPEGLPAPPGRRRRMRARAFLHG